MLNQVPAHERFEAHFIPEPMSGCWLWAGPVTKSRLGYGMLRVGGRQKQLAHRFSWELHCGPIPDGSQVLHECDNSLCVNPDHLVLGDHSKNMKDAFRRGRKSHAGERNPVAIAKRRRG